MASITTRNDRFCVIYSYVDDKGNRRQKFFLDQIGNCSLDLLDVVASRIDANDLLFGWTEPLELFENVNQRNSLDDLASESTFRKLVEDGTR